MLYDSFSEHFHLAEANIFHHSEQLVLNIPERSGRHKKAHKTEEGFIVCLYDYETSSVVGS